MIEYIEHDATTPLTDTCVIAHVVNSEGGWGRGFVVPLEKKYPYARLAYKNWWRGTHEQGFKVTKPSFELGHTQFVILQNDVTVANMLAQKGYISSGNPHPVQLGPLERCLESVFKFTYAFGGGVQMPRVGCGLGGRDWSDIEPIVLRALKKVPALDVYVCDLKKG